MPFTPKNIEYLILSLGTSKISLIQVANSRSWEIKDENFPVILNEKDDDKKASGFSFKGIFNSNFKTNRSVANQVRFTGFLRIADERLKRYLKKDCPLLLAGAERKLKEFEHITHNNSSIAGEIVGRYSDSNRDELIMKSQEFVMTSR